MFTPFKMDLTTLNAYLAILQKWRTERPAVQLSKLPSAGIKMIETHKKIANCSSQYTFQSRDSGGRVPGCKRRNRNSVPHEGVGRRCILHIECGLGALPPLCPRYSWVLHRGHCRRPACKQSLGQKKRLD